MNDELEELQHYSDALLKAYATQCAALSAQHAHIERWQERVRALHADNTRLLAIIGADTPIAAFSLAETWRAEKAGYMEQVSKVNHVLADMVNQYMSAREGYITHEFMSAQEDAIEYLEDIGWLRAGEYERYEWTDVARAATADDVLPVFYAYAQKIAGLTQERDELRSLVRAVIDSAARGLNYVPDEVLVSAAALDGLRACVSSNGAEPARAQIEETQAGYAPTNAT